MDKITWTDFQKIDMRVGTVIDAKDFPEAKRPAIQVWIDFGELGVRKTSAQITKRYSPHALIGRQVVAVVNFPPKQIGPFMSECLVLGAVGESGDVILLSPDNEVGNGSRVS